MVKEYQTYLSNCHKVLPKTSFWQSLFVAHDVPHDEEGSTSIALVQLNASGGVPNASRYLEEASQEMGATVLINS